MEDYTEVAITKLRAALEANPRAVPVLIEEAIALLTGASCPQDRGTPAWHRGYTAGYEKAKSERAPLSGLRPRLDIRAFGLVYEGALQRVFLDGEQGKQFAKVANGELVPMVGYHGTVE